MTTPLPMMMPLILFPWRGSGESWYLAANFGDNREMRSVGDRSDQTVHASSNFS